MNTSTDARVLAQRVTTLFVSPWESDHKALRNIFSRSNWTLQSAFTCSEARERLRRESFPVVISDCVLPDGSWRSLLEKSDEARATPRVIVSSRAVSDHLWADVLQMGGYDLLAMPWEGREVLKVISLAWRSWEFACRTARPIPVSARSATLLTRAAAATALAG